MMLNNIHVRTAREEELKAVGELMYNAYAALDDFLKPSDHPTYYEQFRNIGRLAVQPQTTILVATDKHDNLLGAVVYFGDMQCYGSGGTATTEKDAAGFRFLATDNRFRGMGAGRALTQACTDKAKCDGRSQLIIHTTLAMKNAWAMYERMGFARSPDLDFSQGQLSVFGFRLRLI